MAPRAVVRRTAAPLSDWPPDGGGAGKFTGEYPMKRIIVPTILTLVIGGSAWAVAPKGEYLGRFNYPCPKILELH